MIMTPSTSQPVTVFNIAQQMHAHTHFFLLLLLLQQKSIYLFIFFFCVSFMHNSANANVELNFSCGNKNEIVKEQWIQKSSNGCSVLRLKLPQERKKEKKAYKIFIHVLQ